MSQVVTSLSSVCSNIWSGGFILILILFETLVSFYVEVCLYRDSTPVAARSLYNHDDIAGSFRSVLGPLLEQMTVASQKTLHLEFERQDGLLSVTLPKDVRTAQRVFLLVQKKAVNTQVNLGPLKLAAPTRLATVHQRALSGVTIQAIDQPSLGQSSPGRRSSSTK